ncbi:MAG: RHS repeat protein [Chloroflexota bacterium]|nr:MAG: RHS repeat protein [Chloroflexota bacterium]
MNSAGGGTGDVILVGPQGRSDRYTRNPDGSFTPALGVNTTLVKNVDATYTVTHKDQTTWSFDSGGRLTAIKDRYGNQSTLTYNAGGQLVSVSDPAGRGALSFGYDSGSGRLISVSDWMTPTRTVQYGYDASGRLSTVTDREGKVTTYAYDGTSSRLTTITDARGNVAVTNIYDAQGRVSAQKDAQGLAMGNQTSFTYTTNGDGTTTTIVTYPPASADPSWNPKVEDTYDSNGRMIRRIARPTASSAEDVTQQFGYDASARLTSITDGSGQITNFCYDVDYAGVAIAGSKGNLTRKIEPVPSVGAFRPVTLYQYDGKNNLIQVVPPRGVSSGVSVDCGTNLSGSVNLLHATDMTYDAATQTKLESTTARYTDPDLGQRTAVTKVEYGDADRSNGTLSGLCHGRLGGLRDRLVGPGCRDHRSDVAGPRGQPQREGWCDRALPRGSGWAGRGIRNRGQNGHQDGQGPAIGARG